MRFESGDGRPNVQGRSVTAVTILACKLVHEAHILERGNRGEAVVLYDEA